MTDGLVAFCAVEKADELGMHDRHKSPLLRPKEVDVSAEKVIIDTDPGIDDAQAIIFALLCGEFQIEAVTTCFGNGSVDTSARNALRLLDLVHEGDTPVYRGAAEPLIQRRLKRSVGPRVHGNNGLGDIKLSRPRRSVRPGYAASELARRVVETPGEISVLALAPMTNLALAIRLEPRFAKAVKRVIFMGGIAQGPGNVTPVATANVLNDAEAARVVLNAGVKSLTMVGQDVTRWVRMDAIRRQRLRNLDGPLGKFLYDMTEFYARIYSGIEPGLPGFPIHDLLVMAYALRPELFITERLHVDVETLGALTVGMTVADLRPSSTSIPNVDVCMCAHGEAILDLYERVITQGVKRLGSA